ncbi:TPA: hypothetical protein ACH3X1_014987 [Trebouxia sp. C0004]
MAGCRPRAIDGTDPEAEAEHKLAQVTTEKDAESKELQSRTKYADSALDAMESIPE